MTTMYVTFEIDGKKFAFPSDNVSQVLENTGIKAVPRTHNWIKGVIPYRGMVLPIFELTDLSGFLTSNSEKKRDYILVVDYKEYKNGFLVDKADISDRELESGLDFEGESMVNLNEVFVKDILRNENDSFFEISCRDLHENLEIC